MTDSTQEPSELDEQKMQAVRQIASSIGSHQPVKREGLPGHTCRDRVCAEQGTIFLTRADFYRHQSLVAVNDLISFLRFDRIMDLEENDVPTEDMEDDFTFSLLTDLLDATPAGRSYADRSARKKTVIGFDWDASAADPRLAPAVTAFRKEMYTRGVETSIGKVHASMIEALAAADRAAQKARG